ncbi:endonuclease III [candidate division WWE3 bacterium RIFCSPLOWO2_12_FULL_36_10]|uniref:Endonuclease III n=1 Tax=candidate division WWE3 bacterium RIFCSPLOWO2_12_FULL_36_10 TaxID=1802630 RepID=A0A1F4VHK9_UNCKA|nr:MAG: endonuclease III [candidate division WWE3 bacterium RIFCSPLOWO2_12_FULL_36_10]
MFDKKFAESIAKLLKTKYPDPKTELVHENEMQLAVSVMLSAQTTDKKVNEITSKLFKKYKTWEDFANANLTELQSDIRGVNFHLGKAKRLIKAGRVVTAEFKGVLPDTIEQLTKIPGVARKSANVIIQEIWNKAEGIVVDTHVTRVSNRLGLTKNQDAVKIEKDLMTQIPKEYWRNFSGAMVLHGRYVCTARKPKCGDCVLNKVCPSAFKSGGTLTAQAGG